MLVVQARNGSYSYWLPNKQDTGCIPKGNDPLHCVCYSITQYLILRATEARWHCTVHCLLIIQAVSEHQGKLGCSGNCSDFRVQAYSLSFSFPPVCIVSLISLWRWQVDDSRMLLVSINFINCCRVFSCNIKYQSCQSFAWKVYIEFPRSGGVLRTYDTVDHYWLL